MKDGVGSVVSITDSSETEVNTYRYDAFGKVVNSTETLTNLYGYTGRRYDTESGLMYYRARYYDPAAGRFISADPIGFAGGDVNFYAYVWNNPVNFVDPLGLLECYVTECTFTITESTEYSEWRLDFSRREDPAIPCIGIFCNPTYTLYCYWSRKYEKIKKRVTNCLRVCVDKCDSSEEWYESDEETLDTDRGTETFTNGRVFTILQGQGLLGDLYCLKHMKP